MHEVIRVSEVQIVPIKPRNGHIAFASCVINESLYIGSIAVYTRPKGGYRLVYPTKIVGDSEINVFHPINKQAAEAIETAVYKELSMLQ